MATSYNGWPASPNPADFGGLEKLIVAGESFAPGVRAGDVHAVFQYVAEQLHARVEPVVRADWHQADDWGYSYRANVNNPSTLSCHASGTAIDYNSTRHPNGKRGTYSAEQVVTIHRILAEVNDVVRWGGSFTGTPDEMHFEINGNAAAVKAVADRLRTPASAPKAKHATVQRGSVGPDVELLQRFLGVVGPGDPGYGVFGKLTQAAVIKYQRMRGLVPDGVVGERTWRETGL
jgi:murein L,D-transpeptidase YcbB/YkuD